jgi:Spy/CpxP family protein refolding chaperone
MMPATPCPLSTFRMRNLQLFSAFVMLAVVPGFVRAQQPPSSANAAAVIPDSLSPLVAPAEFVLRNRQSLSLTEAQVGSLEKLAVALRDSTVVRQARSREYLRSGFASVPTNQFEWSEPVDEAAIRENSRRQADRLAESAIERARDRRLIGALLTSEQHAQLKELERADMLARMARRRGSL